MTDWDSVDECVADITSRYDEVDPEVEGVVDRMSSIRTHITRAFEETLAKYELNHGEYKLLSRLSTRSVDRRMSAGDLSRALLISTGAMTNRLDRLEAAGLLRRVPDPKDRRSVLIELTEAGQERIDIAVSEQARKEIDVLSALSGTEMKQLNRLLRKVLISLETDRGVADAG